GSYVLPSNFEEVATGVLKVLNNLALLDITLMQKMLARPDLQMEFFHLMSFLLSHCATKWKVATDQVGMLLLESLLLLGYFALFHPGNQAVLRWGKSPTILHKVCDLPFVFFSDPELMPILAGTLVSACYGSEQNRDVVQQELSTDMLLSLVGSCRNGSLANSIPPNNSIIGDLCYGSQSSNEPKKSQAEVAARYGRCNPKGTRLSIVKGVALGNNARVTKSRNPRDVKATKTCEQWALKHNLPASESSSTFMLHSRFPISFMDRAEEFFSAGISNVSDES
ncbi:S phase cyclin a-associated protein in the endoplasmic reticulum, partial [Thalictrum thalictroides]